MNTNKILNFPVSKTILNRCTKKVEKLTEETMCIYIYIYIYIYALFVAASHQTVLKPRSMTQKSS